MAINQVTKRILVVDNEPYIQEVAKICLESVADWQVLTVGSGQDCLRVSEAEQPDAILLDVMMPDMDGPTTFKKLQTNPATRSIPVILLTAKVQSTDRHRYTEMGLRAAIAKPFNPLELAGQVAAALGWNLQQSERHH
jgi:CheY-like chemotaxis protein